MKVIICGAGIAGLALAQRMHHHGWDVCVVEHAPGPRTQGYLLDFFGLGYDAAEAMGVLPGFKQLAYHVDEVAYVDRNGRRRARLNYTQFSRLVDGRLLAMLRPDLESALREQVVGSVDLRFGCGVVAVDNSATGVSVTLSDGQRLQADLLVGADGIHSTVRRLVFGPESAFFRYLGFHTAAYIFEDEEIHARLGQRFWLTDSANREMGLYALRDGRTAAFAAHRAADPTLPTDRRLALRRIYGSLGWLVPRALDRCPDDSELYYDQVAQVIVPEWSRGRVTLVGDACQAVSLLAGQGASLAVAGAYLLGEQLAKADSIEAALANYQRVWQPVIAEKQRAGRRGAGWFLPTGELQLGVRRTFLNVSNLPVVERLVGTTLVGKSGVRMQELLRPDAPVRSVVVPSNARLDTARAMFGRSPSPILRTLFQVPKVLYRLGLGRLLGHHFMLLAHTGRTSGRVYRTVLEVVHYDARTHESIVCSGWGTRADWYRNVLSSPPLEVRTADERYPSPTFRVLPPQDNYAVVADYTRRMPAIARPLLYHLGFDVRASEPQRRAHSEQLLLVAFRPRAIAPADEASRIAVANGVHVRSA
jgi:deazaflavin-dependent oxidoreductase (nitroreductase family)